MNKCDGKYISNPFMKSIIYKKQAENQFEQLIGFIGSIILGQIFKRQEIASMNHKDKEIRILVSAIGGGSVGR